MAADADLPAGQTAPPAGLDVRRCFWITMAYAVILVAAALAYGVSGMDLPWDPQHLTQVAWFGALGAVMANFSGINRDRAKWRTHSDLWYIARPFLGGVFGAIGYLIFSALVQVSVYEPDDTDKKVVAGTLGYLIAFTLGYQEQTFRELLARVTDLLASAGGADTEPPSPPPALLGSVHLINQDNTVDVLLSWYHASDNIGVVGYALYRDYALLTTVWVEPQGVGRGSTPDAVPDGLARPHAPLPTDAGVNFIDRGISHRRGSHLYSVTAVDRAGNESAPTGPIRVLWTGREDDAHG